MLDSIRYKEDLPRELYILEDENNPNTSKVNTILPKTILDQVFDQYTSKSLRTILDEMNENIKNHGILQINFPVTSVNGMQGDINITKESLGLENVSNIPDEEKLLSDKQREQIKGILDNYNFQSKIDFSEYNNHILNSNNPHHVTVEQIDKDNALKNFVNNYIYKHNTSSESNIHPDIRQTLVRLWDHIDNSVNSFEDKVDHAKELFIKHYEDKLAHIFLFNKKEDKSNKISSISNNNINNINYPTTSAVDIFVNNSIDQKIEAFNKTLPHPINWYDEIIEINNRLDLPDADESKKHKLYIIKYGNNNCTEIAVCLLDNNNFYQWNILSTGAISVIDNKYILNNTNGLTLDVSRVINELMNNQLIINLINTKVSEKFSDIASNYYTKDEINNQHLVNAIKLLPGIDPGTIRYYINNDITTMSPDVLVRGLQRIAFLEYVTEHEIYDQSIHERHIISKALTTRHFQDKTIYSNFLATRNKNVLLGNIDNDKGIVTEISIDSIIDKINNSEQMHENIQNTLDKMISIYDEEDIQAIINQALENTKP